MTKPAPRQDIHICKDEK